MTRFELLADSAAETINGGIDDISVRFKSVRASLRQVGVNTNVTLGAGSATQIGGVLILA
jgi:hypothetical protein